MSDISEKGSDFLRDLGNAARKNPLSAALIGMGVFSLFTGSRPVERGRHQTHGDEDAEHRRTEEEPLQLRPLQPARAPEPHPERHD